MQSTRPSTTATGSAASAGRASGRRGIITIKPGLTSIETLTAGVVVQLADGQIQWRAAIDARKAEHAFGAQGVALHAIAEQLCQALGTHWASGEQTEWRPPFDGAALAQVDEFTARDAESALDFALRRHSSLYTLLSEYEIPAQACERPVDVDVRGAGC